MMLKGPPIKGALLFRKNVIVTDEPYRPTR
jgi:hypothetical protein